MMIVAMVAIALAVCIPVYILMDAIDKKQAAKER